ncbi:HEAT repeat domain-containing protein [Fischerella sp. PCC 9605]|uniref:HEAT repeat domain-containing protein n=1 Tax=Fischerella sp. PCC 9605 TaxID=1173024 RepID=UPI0004787640|nr:DUF1186 domain-containing protein [Fischerella sp. PCC 9605]
MAMATYPSPVNKLLTYGDCRKFQEIPNYIEELGFSSEHIPDLIRMATDQQLNSSDLDGLEIWAPIHAWRALGQLRAEAAIEPLISLFHELDDDWSSSELPDIFGKIGPAAIPALQAYLADSSHDSYDRATAATSLTKIAENHPDTRNQCIAILTQQLELFADNDIELNAFLIGELIDLKAVESASVMERAFAAERVVPFIVGDWNEVQVSLGLKDPTEVPERKFSLEERIDYFALKPQSQKPRGFSTTSDQKQKKKNKKNKKRK